MTVKSNDYYFLSKNQMDILLNRIGFKSVYSFSNGSNITEEEYQKVIYEEIMELIKIGILGVEEKGLIIEENIKEILTNIGKAKKHIRLVSNNEEYNEYMCYLYDNIVVILSDSITRKNKISVMYMDKEEFWNEFFQNLLPDMAFSEMPEETEELIKFEDDVMQEYNNGIVSNELFFLVTIHNESNEIKNLYCLEYNSIAYEIFKIDENVIRIEYNKEIIIGSVKDMVEQ